MRSARLALALAAIALLGACAHPLAIGPDIDRIERESGAQPIAKNVGYYIDPRVREQPVTTPGGGGDSVTYTPYRDIEAGFYKMLGNVFQGVTALKSPDQATTSRGQALAYVITPTIKTDSSSSGAFTWPPTQFSLMLTCNVSDGAGRPVASASVSGDGHAEYDEFKSDFSLAGKRAAQDALLKMQRMLLELPELRAP